MLDILITSAGFFLMIFIAYVMKQHGILRLEDKDFLGKVLINVCLPAVIVMSFQEFVFDVSLIAAFLIGMCCNLLGVFVGYFFARNGSKEKKSLLMILTAGYNIGIFTIPFVSSFFVSSAVLGVMMFDVGNAVFVMGTSAAIVGAILNNEKGNPFPDILKKMSRSPCILAYVVMFVLIMLPMEIPSFVFTIADIPSRATSYLAMTMVGVMLDFKINPEERKELLTLLALRYGYSFAIGCLLFFLLPFDVEVKKGLMIAVLSPMSTASMVFAQSLGCKPSLVGGAGTFSILISMILIVSVTLFL